MQLFQKYKYELILAIILVGFVAFKWYSLFLPYFWDELAYYAKAGLYLHDNGLSMLPSGLPPDLSRGHPLLFQFLTGSWFYVFGTTLFSGHSLPLLISILTLTFIFKFGSLIDHKVVGILSAITLAIQPVFISQSALVLPEITIALFTLIAIYFLLKENVLISLLFSILIVLTKETGIVVPIIISLYVFWNNKSFKQAVIHLTPILILVLFFCIQKFQNGWFLFPFHLDIMAVQKGEFLLNILESFYFIFIAQYRFVFSVFFVIQVYFTFRIHKKESLEFKFTVLSIVIILFTIVLISGLYKMNRYYLSVFPLYIIVGSLGMKNVFNSNKFTFPFFLLSIAPILKIQNQIDFNIDVDSGYKNCIVTTQKTYNYLIENKLSEKPIYCHFSILRAFGDERLGYNINSTEFNLQEEKSKDVDYAIEINPNGWNRVLNYWNDFTLVKTIKEGNFEVLIFKK